MKRKWSESFLSHCITYKKFRNKEKYLQIIKMFKRGLSIREIALFFNVTYQAIFWYQKQELYKQLLDSGEVNIEDSESQNTENEEK